MATLDCGSLHQQLLQPGCGAMGFSCDKVRQQMAGSSSFQMQAARYGPSSFSSLMGPRRLEIVGMRSKFRAQRRTLVFASSTKARKDFGCWANLAGFTDSAADISGRREEEESRASNCAARDENLSKFDVESLIHGHVGRFAFLGILLLGVGVGCLTNVGDAEAATSHISSNNGGLDVDMRALALGPEGPLLEEFWDNMRRYGLYFLTVVTGGVYQLVKPAVDALRNPVTAVLIIVVVTGSVYLVGLTVSAMLGINEFQYDYAT